MFLVTVPLAVHKRIASRAWLAASCVVVSVTSESAERVVVPATAESSKEVIELLTVSPHAPVNEPVVGRARPRSGVAMNIPYAAIGVQSGEALLSLTCTHPGPLGFDVITVQFDV